MPVLPYFWERIFYKNVQMYKYFSHSMITSLPWLNEYPLSTNTQIIISLLIQLYNLQMFILMAQWSHIFHPGFPSMIKGSKRWVLQEHDEVSNNGRLYLLSLSTETRNNLLMNMCLCRQKSHPDVQNDCP